MDKSSTVFSFWRELGLSVRAANILVNLSCQSLLDVQRLGSDELLRQHGIGPPTYNEIARLLGWDPIDADTRRRRLMQPFPVYDPSLEAAVAVVGFMIKRA